MTYALTGTPLSPHPPPPKKKNKVHQYTNVCIQMNSTLFSLYEIQISNNFDILYQQLIKFVRGIDFGCNYDFSIRFWNWSNMSCLTVCYFLLFILLSYIQFQLCIIKMIKNLFKTILNFLFIHNL